MAAVAVQRRPIDWQIVGTADFNGDLKADIVWENPQLRVATIWLMDGANRLGSGAIPKRADANWTLSNP